MQATLTLKKEDLLEKLNERRDEINEHFDKKVQKIDDEIARRQDEKIRLGSLAEWHRSVAEGLESGEISLTKSGSLKNAPIKPGSSKARGASYHYEISRAHESTLDAMKDGYEKDRSAALKEINVSIDLIELSTGKTVEVDAADYQHMLTRGFRHGWY